MPTDGRSGSGGAVDVAIVGAGITGLTLCRELSTLGRSAVACEAADRVGGVIESRRAEGRVVEHGPQRTRLAASVSGLVEELGLESEVVTAPRDLPLFVVRDGRLRRAPLDPPGFLCSRLLSPSGKLRLLAEPLAGPPREGESVADYLRRGYGEEAYRHLLGPLVGGIYASDPARMPAQYSLVPLWRASGVRRSVLLSVLRRWVSGEGAPPACSFRDGLSTLTDALGRECGERVRTGTAATRVARAAAGPRVELAGGDELRARRVVLTVPADEAGRLLADEGGNGAGRLRRLRYNPLAVVHLLSPAELRGYGYQFSLGEEEFVTRGVTWNASLFGRDGVHTAFLGGMDREEAVDRPDGWLGRTAAREFRQVTGVRARPVSVHRTRVPAHDESWRALDGVEEALPPGVRLCANYESRAAIPSRIRGARRLARELDAELADDAGGDRGRSGPAAGGGATRGITGAGVEERDPRGGRG